MMLPSRNANSSFYGKEIDLWSAGVIMYVLLEGKYPFHGNDKSKIQWHRSVLDGNYPEPKNGSQAAKNLIRRLLEVDTKKRITASEALRDDFFFPPSSLSSSEFCCTSTSDHHHHNNESASSSSPHRRLEMQMSEAAA